MKRVPALILTIIITSCHPTDQVKPILQPITESVYASGVVKARHQHNVHSTVPGVVEEILVDEGDEIEAGQPIMRISNNPSRLNRENSKLVAVYENYHANSDKLQQAEASIEFLFDKMKNDSLLATRQRNLWQQGIGARVELEQSELNYKNSRTSYFQAKLNYRDLKRDLLFRSRQAETNFKISTTLAGDYLIKSISKGRVYKMFPDRGEYVNTVNPVAIIGDADDFVIELKVDEYDIALVDQNQRITISMDSYRGKVFEARIEQIEPFMDEESRSFIVRASFITKPPALFPNLSVQANIVTNFKERALTIPRNYLLGDTAVILQSGEQRKVEVGVMDYQRAEITSGLQQTDVIQKPVQ